MKMGGTKESGRIVTRSRWSNNSQMPTAMHTGPIVVSMDPICSLADAGGFPPLSINRITDRTGDAGVVFT